MYNGIGVTTTRGTGTNGYVMRNLSHVRTDKKDNQPKYDYNDKGILGGFESTLVKKPNKDILEHDRKRQVELKCIELQDMLEEKGTYEEAEITEKVNEMRKMLLEKEGLNNQTTDAPAEAITSTTGLNSHQIAEASQNKNAKMRNAFGIKEEFPEGSSFKEEHQKTRKEEEKAERELKYKEREKEREKHRKREDKEAERHDRDRNADRDRDEEEIDTVAVVIKNVTVGRRSIVGLPADHQRKETAKENRKKITRKIQMTSEIRQRKNQG